jgi:hypothetical protein
VGNGKSGLEVGESAFGLGLLGVGRLLIFGGVVIVLLVGVHLFDCKFLEILDLLPD